MTFEQYAWDGAKLVAQLVGALGIARLTVTWALGRHKTEKHWEQRLKAYAELVSALGDLIDVLADWEDEALGLSNHNEATVRELRDRRNRAKHKLTEIGAIAELLLPKMVAVKTREFRQALARIQIAHHDTMLDHVNSEHQITSDFRDFVVKFGRTDLGLHEDSS